MNNKKDYFYNFKPEVGRPPSFKPEVVGHPPAFKPEVGRPFKSHKNIKNDIGCTNCGKYGHKLSVCTDPVTSCGLLMFRIKGLSLESLISVFNNLWITETNKRTSGETKLKSPNRNTDFSINIENSEDLKYYNHCKDKVEFLMGTRKNSFEMFLFMMGKYDEKSDINMIKIFKHLTQDEISIIEKNMSYKGFDILWKYLWSTNENINNVIDYENSRSKFLSLVNGVDSIVGDNEKTLEKRNMKYYISNVKSQYSSEVTFFKGRRSILYDITTKKNRCETNMECAIREVKEEAGVVPDEYVLFDKIEALQENFKDDKDYRNILYLACLKPDIEVDPDKKSKLEFSKITWFTFENVMSLIRPYHTSRKDLLTRVYMFIIGRLLKNKPTLNHISSKHIKHILQESESDPSKLVTQGFDSKKLVAQGPAYGGFVVQGVDSKELIAQSFDSKKLVAQGSASGGFVAQGSASGGFVAQGSASGGLIDPNTKKNNINDKCYVESSTSQFNQPANDIITNKKVADKNTKNLLLSELIPNYKLSPTISPSNTPVIKTSPNTSTLKKILKKNQTPELKELDGHNKDVDIPTFALDDGQSSPKTPEAGTVTLKAGRSLLSNQNLEQHKLNNDPNNLPPTSKISISTEKTELRPQTYMRSFHIYSNESYTSAINLDDSDNDSSIDKEALFRELDTKRVFKKHSS